MLASTPTISFEFFPPKTEEQGEKLWQCIVDLADLQPRFVSVTCGAGGSTRDRTDRLVKRIREETELEPAAHLTCVGSSREDIRQVAEDYWQSNIRHIVALRGDPPADTGEYIPHPEGYAYADTLVAGLKEVADFEISVAAYPETHPQAVSPEDDLAHLKRKIDAGATRAITQYFFDVPLFADFVARASAIGIEKPIIPGILPVGNYKQMVKFSAMCGAGVPDWIHERFGDVEDAEKAKALAIDTAVDQCRQLIDLGVTHIHFYTLNRADLVTAVCKELGIA